MSDDLIGFSTYTSLPSSFLGWFFFATSSIYLIYDSAEATSMCFFGKTLLVPSLNKISHEESSPLVKAWQWSYILTILGILSSTVDLILGLVEGWTNYNYFFGKDTSSIIFGSYYLYRKIIA